MWNCFNGLQIFDKKSANKSAISDISGGTFKSEIISNYHKPIIKKFEK